MSGNATMAKSIRQKSIVSPQSDRGSPRRKEPRETIKSKCSRSPFERWTAACAKHSYNLSTGQFWWQTSASVKLWSLLGEKNTVVLAHARDAATKNTQRNRLGKLRNSCHIGGAAFVRRRTCWIHQLKHLPATAKLREKGSPAKCSFYQMRRRLPRGGCQLPEHVAAAFVVTLVPSRTCPEHRVKGRETLDGPWWRHRGVFLLNIGFWF